MAVVIGWMTLGVWAGYPFLAWLGVKVPVLDRYNGGRWLPQHWTFFSADPKRSGITAFAVSEGGWTRSLQSPLAEPGNLYGWRRTPRAQFLEMTHLLTMSNPTFEGCDADLTACIGRVVAFKPVENDWVSRTFCGRTIFAWRRRPPWTVFATTNDTLGQVAVVSMDIRC